jgi:hypothetical protein
MPMDDSADRDQANARAFEFLWCVQALEGLEQLRGVSHVKTGTVVPHAEGALATDIAGGVHLPGQRNAGLGGLAGALPSVGHHIFHPWHIPCHSEYSDVGT